MNHLFICFSAVQMYDHSCIHLKNQYVIYLKEFHGQGINDTVDRQKFQVPVSARYIRFHPIQQHGWNCLRVEAYIIESKFSSFFHSLPSRQFCSNFCFIDFGRACPGNKIDNYDDDNRWIAESRAVSEFDKV